jgi:hypothetical protein
MNKKTFDQVNGYSRLIVRELHDVVMDDDVYDKLKVVLLLAEELETYMMQVQHQETLTYERNNIVQFRRPA